jgi:outer membrane protein
MTKFMFGAALAALTLSAPGAAVAQRGGASTDVLVVDITRISTECNACRTAAATLQGQTTALQQRQQQLASINALAGKQPDAALQARIRAFETQRNTAAQEIQSRGQQIESIGANVNVQIDSRLRVILEQIRAQHNATVIIAKGATWASLPAADVTNEALTQLNAQLPSVSLTPLPQAAQPAQPQGR